MCANKYIYTSSVHKYGFVVFPFYCSINLFYCHVKLNSTLIQNERRATELIKYDAMVNYCTIQIISLYQYPNLQYIINSIIWNSSSIVVIVVFKK